MNESYRDIMRKNLKDYIDREFGSVWNSTLESMKPRQLYRVITSESDITLSRLEAIAAELEVEFLSMFAHRK